MESTEAKTNSAAFMGSQLMMSDEPTDDDWENSKSSPYITAAKVIKDGRKMEIWKTKAPRLMPLRNRFPKLATMMAVAGKAIAATTRLMVGDLANPVGTKPFVRLALTEERAKIFAIFKISLRFKAGFLIFRGLQQSL